MNKQAMNEEPALETITYNIKTYDMGKHIWEEAQNKKTIIESYGFTVTIRSDYILDLSKNVITSNEQYNFYNEVIVNLLNSLKNQDIIISDQYYSNPVDIELFSNMTMLMTIKNDNIKGDFPWKP